MRERAGGREGEREGREEVIDKKKKIYHLRMKPTKSSEKSVFPHTRTPHQSRFVRCA